MSPSGIERTAGTDGTDRTDRSELGRLLRGAARVLAEAGVPSPDHDAWELASHALGLPRLDHTLHDVPPGFAAGYAELVERRRRREPLQHIVGSTVFRHVSLRVEPGVFVPRPETETVAGVAVDHSRRLAAAGAEPLVVDLCCGAGGIAVSVDVEVPRSRVVAVDLSPEAVALTRHNAGLSGTPALRVEEGDATSPDLLPELTGLVDVVVANPPYIPPDAVPLDPEVRDHDPDLALYGGGADGLEVPRGVVRTAARLLRPAGLLVMEHAEVQAAAVRALVEATGAFTDVRTETDLTGRDRMVVALRLGGAVVEDSPS